MSRPTDARLSASGVVLHVRQAGTGPVVLLLHGFPDSCELWHDVSPLLVAAGFRVIAPDLRGFGRSDAPASVGDYALGHVVADLRALIGRMADDAPVRVIGHDWGAVAGWCLALEHPQLVRSLVALSVGHPRQYAVAGLEQKLKGLYTLAWQVPGWRSAGLRNAAMPACVAGVDNIHGSKIACRTCRGRVASRPDSTGIGPICVACCSGPGRRAPYRRSASGAAATIFSPRTRCAIRQSACRRRGGTAHRARGPLVAARAAGPRRGARAAVVCAAPGEGPRVGPGASASATYTAGRTLAFRRNRQRGVILRLDLAQACEVALVVLFDDGDRLVVDLDRVEA